jgi:hypothetical protein
MIKSRIPANAVAFYLKIEAASSSLSRANLSGVVGKETRTSLERSLENYRQNLAAAWYQTPNHKAVVDRFEEINGKADSFTLRARDALESAAWAEERLEALGVPKSARAGVELVRSSGGPSANAYKHGAIGTAYTLRRTSAGHYDLVSINRVTIHPRQKEIKALRVSEAARDAIHQKAMDGISLLPNHITRTGSS